RQTLLRRSGRAAALGTGMPHTTLGIRNAEPAKLAEQSRLGVLCALCVHARWNAKAAKAAKAAKTYIGLVLCVFCVLGVLSAVAGAAPPVRTMYNDALAREQSVRPALAVETPSPAVVDDVHAVIARYEALVRR